MKSVYLGLGLALSWLAAGTLSAAPPDIPLAQHLDEARASRTGKSARLFLALGRTLDPDVRRQLLFELSMLPETEADDALASLLSLFPGETEESVQLAYATAVATLGEKPAANAAAALDFLQRCAVAGATPSLRIHAFNTLSFHGLGDVQDLPPIRVDDPALRPEVLAGLPAALARCPSSRGLALLWSLADQEEQPVLALEASACLCLRGALAPEALVDRARKAVETRGGDEITVKAASVLMELAQAVPAYGPTSLALVKAWQVKGGGGYSDMILADMLEKQGIVPEVTVSAYAPGKAVSYAKSWWNGCNHSCSSAYSACTPWSYWGGELCGYASHGGDCADFVSQCLIAGGHAYLNTGAPCRGYPCGKEEIGATNLGNCLHDKGWVRTCGHLQAPPANLAVGDVLVYHNSSCTDADAHATLVVSVAGSDVRIACHSSMQWNKSYTYMAGEDPYYEWLHYPAPVHVESVSAPARPSGPATGTCGATYTYTLGGAASSLSHTLNYDVDWGDGTSTGWIPNGTLTATHHWVSAGTFPVKAKARCATHTSIESGWSATLSVVQAAPWSDPYEPNNASTNATPLVSGANFKAAIGVSGDVDWYKFTLTAKKAVTITCTLPSGADYDMELYNPGYVTGSYNAPGVTESIARTLAAGTYYVRVYGNNGAHSATAAYVLKAVF